MKKISVLCVVASLLSFVACDKKSPQPGDNSGSQGSQPSSSAQLPSTGIQSYSDAIKEYKPLMHDARGDLDSGAAAFALWSAQHLKWSDVHVKKNETSIPLVMKDSDEERAKRMCYFGSVVQISVAKTEQGKIAEGLLMGYGGSLVHFEAVGSSGELVSGSYAQICGVITGLFDYSNSGGGVGHAVQMVGMFDLPQNRRAVANRETSSVGKN